MKDKIETEDKVTGMFCVLLAITFIWDLIVRGGEKAGRILLIYITIFAIKLLFTKTFMKKSKSTYNIALFFVFIAMYLGNVMNFYDIPHYDKYLHLTSGVLLGFIGFILYGYLFGNENNKAIRPMAIVIFPLIFAIACAGVWEIWEFSTDQIFGLMAQNNSLHDTMWDIICGTIGGSFSCVLIYMYSKGKNIKFIERMLEEIK